MSRYVAVEFPHIPLGIAVVLMYVTVSPIKLGFHL